MAEMKKRWYVLQLTIGGKEKKGKEYIEKGNRQFRASGLRFTGFSACREVYQSA